MSKPPEYQLVLANGAFKSGSTWLREILQRIRPFERLPEAYVHVRLRGWVAPHRIEALLRDPACPGPYLSKSHLFARRQVDALRRHPKVRICLVTRALPDVLVSHYHHFMRYRGSKLDLERYYWRIGRYKAQELIDYHAVWSDPHPQVFRTSYEALLTDFEAEVLRMGRFLGVTLEPDAVAAIRSATSLDSLRRDWNEADKHEADRFFRKGVVGEGQQRLSPEALADLEALETHGLTGLAWWRYQAVFPLRRWIQRAVQRLR